jgi:hypothetical protein
MTADAQQPVLSLTVLARSRARKTQGADKKHLPLSVADSPAYHGDGSVFGEVKAVAQTTLRSLEKRVAALEKGMSEWLSTQADRTQWRDWRKAVGDFVPSELSEQVDAAGRKIREADRRKSDA